jgi:hypothetical protein
MMSDMLSQSSFKMSHTTKMEGLYKDFNITLAFQQDV